MEDVLEVYHRPHDPPCPVVCVDETSKQLIVETRKPIPAKPGRPARYEYERNGTANLFRLLAISSGTKYLELASDEVDHRLEVVRRAVSAGLGLGSLHEAIDAFKDAVGDVGVVPAQDAVPVPLDGPGGIDHGLKAAMGRPEIPPLEEGLGVLT